jgi:ribose transport system substrate-binding protein
MRRNTKQHLTVLLLAASLALAACSKTNIPQEPDSAQVTDVMYSVLPDTSAHSAVDFNHELDAYVPKKDSYSFYFTYKIVHPWWDAVALGMEEAQRQFLARGITVTYEYMAPDSVSADDQAQRLHAAETAGYDVIGVDVADESIISPILDSMVDSGDQGHDILQFRCRRGLQKDRLRRQYTQLRGRSRSDRGSLRKARV